MNGRRIAMLLVGLLTLSQAASGQVEDRRYRLPDRAATSRDLEELLKQRLAQLQNNDEARKLLAELVKGKFSEDQLRQLRDFQKVLQANPTLQKEIQDRFREQPELRKAVEDALKKQNLSTDQMRQLVTRITRDPPPDQPMFPDPESPSRFPPHPFPGERPPSPQLRETPPLPPYLERMPESTTEWFGREASEWAKTLTRGLGDLDNQTLRGLVESMQKSGVMPTSLELPGWLKSATGAFPTDLKAWLPQNADLPNVNLGAWNVGTPDLPSFAAPESPGYLLSVLLVIALVVCATLVVWHLHGRGLFTSAVQATRRLGPWPVAPGGVATRGEVVHAFEYLARLVLGLPAETSHHRDLGRQIAERSATPQQRAAARDLADLYEYARYTPPDEKFGPEDLARARAALLILATVNAV